MDGRTGVRYAQERVHRPAGEGGVDDTTGQLAGLDADSLRHHGSAAGFLGTAAVGAEGQQGDDKTPCRGHYACFAGISGPGQRERGDTKS